MNDTLNIEDVGLAEAVLTRLIHERKTLEDAAQTLATYRQVYTDLPFAQAELSNTREELKGVKSDLSQLQTYQQVQIKAAEERTAEEIAKKMDEHVRVMEELDRKENEMNIAVMNTTLKLVQLEMEYENMKSQYTAEIEHMQKDIEVKKDMLCKLQEAINNITKSVS